MITEKDYCVYAKEADINTKGLTEMGRMTFKLLVQEEARLSDELVNAKWYRKLYLKRKITEYHKSAQVCAYATLALEERHYGESTAMATMDES